RRCASSPRHASSDAAASEEAAADGGGTAFSLTSGSSRRFVSSRCPDEALWTIKVESQKLQTRTLDCCTAPHCRHVFVTGRFCAADASTPVRRELLQDTTDAKKASEYWGFCVSKRYREEFTRAVFSGKRNSGLELLREHVATERNAAVQRYRGKIGTLAAL